MLFSRLCWSLGTVVVVGVGLFVNWYAGEKTPKSRITLVRMQQLVLAPVGHLESFRALGCCWMQSAITRKREIPK